MSLLSICFLTLFIHKFQQLNAQVDCSLELLSLDLGGSIDWSTEIYNFLNPFDSSDGVSLGGASTGSSQVTCDVCSSALYNVSAWLTIDTTLLGIIGLDVSDSWIGDGIEMSIGGSVSSEFCGSETLCAIISGYQGAGDSSCQLIKYGMDIWIPTTCNETANYNAFELGYSIEYGFSCCSDDPFCNDGYFDDVATCDDAGGLGSYVDGIVGCWQDIQVELATYLFCNTLGSGLASFKSDCFDSDTGEWDSSAVGDCAYQLTCNNDFVTFLERFGACACTVADSTGYPGDLISTLLEILWSEYCGDSNLTCSDSGGLELTIEYFNIYLDIEMFGSVAGFKGNTVRENDIMLILTTMGYVDESVVNFTYEGATDSTTYVLTTITTTSEQAANEIFGRYTDDNFTTTFRTVQESLADRLNESGSIGVRRLSNGNVSQETVVYDGSGLGASDSTILYTTNWVYPSLWELAATMTADATGNVILAILAPLLIANGFGLYWHIRQSFGGEMGGSKGGKCSRLRCC